jgi:hypothetical protein
VRIPVKAYIRTDIVITPDSVKFGEVEAGASANQTLEIAYAGRPDWKIEEVKTANPSVKATLSEVSRQAGNIKYQVTVALQANAPIGSIREQFLLVTNDRNSPQVPVEMQGRVVSDVIVTPETITFGPLRPGQTGTQNVVLRMKRSFSIEKIECEGEHGAFRAKLPADSKPVQVLPLSFVPDSTMNGPLQETFTLTIAGRKDPITIKARASVLAPSSAGGSVSTADRPLAGSTAAPQVGGTTPNVVNKPVQGN